MEIRNAKIKETSLGFENGLLTAWLHLEYSNSEGQGFGGYYLIGGAMAGFIDSVLKIVGVERWENLKGEHIRVKQDYDKVHEIGHLLEDKWFKPQEFFGELKKECICGKYQS